MDRGSSPSSGWKIPDEPTLFTTWSPDSQKLGVPLQFGATMSATGQNLIRPSPLP